MSVIENDLSNKSCLKLKSGGESLGMEEQAHLLGKFSGRNKAIERYGATEGMQRQH